MSQSQRLSSVGPMLPDMVPAPLSVRLFDRVRCPCIEVGGWHDTAELSWCSSDRRRGQEARFWLADTTAVRSHRIAW